MNDLEKSIREYLKIRDQIKILPEDIDYKIAKNYLSFFEMIEKSKTSIVAIFDYYKKGLYYISERFFEVFGFNKEHTLTMEHSYVRSLVHPEDAFVNEAGGISLNYIRKQKGNNKMDYRFIGDFRMRNSKGQWLRIYLQDLILETDKKGNPWLNLKLFDYSVEDDMHRAASCSLRNMKTGEIIFTFDANQFKKTVSSREKEVLDLMSEGLRSKEIADKLYISVNTVNIHRRNIIEKLGATNSSEAIKSAIRLKLI